MTATAFAHEPALDFFENADYLAPRRPELQLIQGGRVGPGQTPPSTTVEAIRRRRFIALMAFTIAVLLVTQLMGISLLSVGAAPTSAVDQAVPAVHVVRPGDSYGAIATLLGAQNPIEAAEYLRSTNGGGDLLVGQRLVVDLVQLSAGA